MINIINQNYFLANHAYFLNKNPTKNKNQPIIIHTKKKIKRNPQKLPENFNLNEFNKYFWDFKPQIYKTLNPDLKTLNNNELITHYYNKGRYEGRSYNNGIKIVICCDPWNDNGSFATGGNKALYNLGKLINEKKHKNIYAKMLVLVEQNNPNPFCNFFACRTEINSRTLVIYPDGNYGNPLNAKNVMRWILLEIGTTYRPYDICKTWKQNDLVYHWEASNISKNTKILNTCVIDDIFKNNNIPRKYNSSCYLIKKRLFYESTISTVHPPDALCIDNLSKNVIVDAFNKYEKFYCYDLKTFFIIGAIICGCKVILVPDSRNKSEYISESVFRDFEKINCFFAWGEEDLSSINYTANDLNDLINYLNNLSKSVDVFLEDVYNYFNSLPVNIPTVNSVYNQK